MAMNPEPGKLRQQVKILLLCLVVLAGLYYIQQQSDPDAAPFSSLFPGEVNHKQDLRNKYAKYRAGRLSASRMLDACIQKLMYAEKGKDALAEYAYALRSQVYLDEGDPEAALAEARKAADIAPSPGRGAVALGDALRALGRDDEAAGAYRQALRNPGYVPEYTAEDPMSSQTLDALFDSDPLIAGEKEYKDLHVRGKLVQIYFGNLGDPYFTLGGIRSRLGVFCYFHEDDEIILERIGTHPRTPGFGITIAQAYGLAFIAQTKGQTITVKGLATPFGPDLTFIDNCLIIKIEP